MIFEVKYRSVDGAISKKFIEATNRAECVAECKRLGIVPTRIGEGSGESHGNTGISKKITLLAASAAAISLALVSFWYFGRTEQAPLPVGKTEKVKAAKPRRKIQMEPAQTNASHSVSAQASRNVSQDSVAIARNPGNAVTRPAEDAATSAPTNSSPLSRPSPFKSGTEQVMGWIFTCPVGKMPPMLPAIPPEELARIGEILDSPNLVQDGDSERIADMKETVALAKQELKAFLAQGGKVEDFLAHYHSVLVKAHQARETARMAAESLDREDPGLSEEFRKKVNEVLNQEGIEALDDK